MAPDFAGGLRVPNERPKVGVTTLPSGKMAKKRVGYSLGGGRGRISSSGLGMAPDFVGGLRVPNIGYGHSRAQNSAPEDRGAKTPQRKNGQKTGGL